MEQTQTPEASQSDVEKYKSIAALAYLIFFLPLITDAKDSKFAMFHANQVLLVLIMWVVSSFILAVPVLGWVLSPILALAAFIFFILGIVNAMNGQMKP